MNFSPARGTTRALRIALACALTLLLLWWSEPGHVLEVALSADWRWLAAAVGLVIVDRALMAWRWIALLPPGLAAEHGIRPLLRIFFVSTFAGTFLPGSVGGDAVRAWQLSSSSRVAGAASVATVVMDRLLGTAALISMAGAGTLLMGSLREGAGITAAVAAGAAVVAGALAVLTERGAALARRCTAWLPAFIDRNSAGVLRALRGYQARRGVLAAVFTASLAVNVLRILQAALLGLALAIDAPLVSYFAFVPVILLIMLLPVSISGIGTSQAGFVFFFGRAGVPEAEAFALSVLYLALGLLGNIPGGLLVAAGRAPAVQR